MRRWLTALLLVALVAHPLVHLLDDGTLPCAGGRDLAVTSAAPQILAQQFSVAESRVAESRLTTPAERSNDPARAPPSRLS